LSSAAMWARKTFKRVRVVEFNDSDPLELNDSDPLDPRCGSYTAAAGFGSWRA
jgi:hypothetical protein